MKTERVIDKEELDSLDFENWTTEDYDKWKDLFGTKTAANQLREAYRHFRKINS